MTIHGSTLGVFTCALIFFFSFCQRVRSENTAFAPPVLQPTASQSTDVPGTYARPADNPQPPGDYFSPRFSGATHNGTPITYAHTFNAFGGRSLILQGSGYTALEGEAAGADTKVWMYSQKSAEDESLRSVSLLRDSSDSVTVATPDNIPYGVYLFWVENKWGPGRPIRVNNAEAWWLRPNRAKPGNRVSVFGRNLSHGNGNEWAFVYIRPAGADASTASQMLRVAEVNPYRVTFELPTELSPGEYEIWAHNGHGGEYGWSSPLTLQVNAASDPFQGGKRLDIRTFGALPAAGGDDTEAIQRAFKEAKAGDTLYFPAGRYTFSKPTELSVGVSIEGESKASTTLEFVNGSGHAGTALRIKGFPSRIRNISIQSQITSGLRHQNPVVFFDGRFMKPSPNDVVVEETRCELPAGQLYSCFGVNSVNYIRFENNEAVAGSTLMLERAHQVLVTNNTFIGNWPDQEYSPLSAVGASVSADVEVTNNRAFSRNRGARETLSRFYVAQGHSHGVTYNHYVADNDIDAVGCALETCGENILIEAPGTLFAGPGQLTGEVQLKFAGTAWRPQSLNRDDPTFYETAEQHRPAIVAIQSGRGEGQYRRILSNTSDSITIDHPWDIKPDSNSVFTIVTTAYHKVIYRNTIEGWPEALNNPHRLNVGIQSYGSLLDSVIAYNTISTVSRGIEISSLVNRSCGFALEGFSFPTAGNNCPTWGVLIEENQVDNTNDGITGWVRVEDPPRENAGPALLNNVIRQNRVMRSSRKAVSFGDTNRHSKHDNWMVNTIFEANYIENSTIHVEMLGSQKGSLLRNNVLVNDRPDLMGIRFEYGVSKSYLYGNYIAGEFGEALSGDVPHGPLQPTDRSIRLTATENEPADFADVASLTNVGVYPLVVQVSVDSPWLEAQLGKTELSPQDPATGLGLRIKEPLAAGEHSATLTLTPGGGTPVTIGIRVSVQSK